MNMISQLRDRVRQNGKATITADEYDQLQREWIMRAGAEEMVVAEREACALAVDSLKRMIGPGHNEIVDACNREIENAVRAIRMRSNE